MSLSHIINVGNLTKNYGNVKAVKGIDFYVNEGELFAFLGPNGAGKTTTIDIICTLLKPDRGTVIVNGCTLGKQDDKIRKNIGVVFQDSILDNLLTVKENLYTRGSFYGLL
jgi:multidrug/hemolysin transport system ATP-binding protein